MAPTGQRQKILICLGLIVITLIALYPVRSNDFVNYDDNLYVTDNAWVQQGLTAKSMTWAFTTGHSANWHPLTWLSHQLDWDLYGAKPAGHHLTNLLFHLANTLLLFLLLARITKSLWPGAITAALFAIHPLHVESVAWVAERKDVLSTFFWLLTTYAYVIWSARPILRHYLLVIILFALGLMAKPMLVTLPCTLLLLDYWPLGRLGPGKPLWQLLWEKAPLFLLAAGSSLITFLVQQGGGAVQSMTQFSLATRLLNSANAYALYLGKTLWPMHLAVYYPYDDAPGLGTIAIALLVLGGITGLVIHQAKRRPYLPVGWFWFLGTLVPVIGLVQVGGQALADRYTYVPVIGLFIIITWGLAELAQRKRANPLILGLAAGLVLISLLGLSRQQVGYWRNSITLFTHAQEVTENNNLAHNSLGSAYLKIGKKEESLAHFRRALEINEGYLNARENLGVNLFKLGRRKEAMEAFNQVLARQSHNVKAHNYLGAILGQQGKTKAARKHLEAALASNPNYAEAHNNLGILLAIQNDLTGATRHFTRAMEIKPNDPEALENLGAVYDKLGQRQAARQTYTRLLKLQPNNAKARRYLQRP